jgi:outer membrane protein assembly factor BamE (lipoprotein component of BamABCDE complex)
MSNSKTIAAVLSASLLISGCSATQHLADVRGAEEIDRVTVGTVQKEIRIGMAAADVASVLGSPNIVTSDDTRRESWIYDKISTEVVESRSSGTLVGLIFGSSGGGAGVGSMSGGARSTSQRTLTVIIRFDEAQRVRDFSYHTSSF